MHNSALETVYRGARVLVTGHTGFKGAWMTEWLLALGAEVIGYALPPPTTPSLFVQLGHSRRIYHNEGDVRDLAALTRVVRETKPSFIFHLAAQPLVRVSYVIPVETYEVNVMGTVHLLEAVRTTGIDCNVVCVTTDKCYENREWVYGYREVDPMGGFDPYSSSKGAAELAISAYRRSYFSGLEEGARVASARAGNVIGGGDWAVDRIVPDCIRSLRTGDVISVRNRSATRPWQHVLEPVSGYLWLAASMSKGSRFGFLRHPSIYADAFNFGPSAASTKTVGDLVKEVLLNWAGISEDRGGQKTPHEAGLLSLSIDKAQHLLGWCPVWLFKETVEKTISWYRETYYGRAEPGEITRAQIAEYSENAATAGIVWACEGEVST